MAGLIVDTSFLVALEREGIVELSSLLGEDSAVASITVSELFVGVYRSAPSERRNQREAFVESIVDRWPVLPLDVRVARVHARLGTELQQRGQRIGAHDLIIAATALAHNYDVLTHNLREFQRVPGLTVRSIDWRGETARGWACLMGPPSCCFCRLRATP